jgi:diguanylate cyclase (GGDEF)-like protein
MALAFTFIVFLFGIFRLTRREFVSLTLYTLAAYALVVNLLFHWRAETVQSAYVEWFSWLLLAAVLPWFGMVGGQISEMRNRLRGANAELTSAMETIQKLATHDELTGLYNRAVFTESLRHALAQSARHGRRLALFFIDIDRFKVINDTLGHAAGDRVLREIAGRLKSGLRESDIVARLGGDEFVVLVEDSKVGADVELIARKIVGLLSRPMKLEGNELPLSGCVGVATAPEDGLEVEALLRNADAAMYRAKQQGRNGYVLYAREMNERDADRLALETELGHALERGQLRLHFQPKVSIASDAVTGVEALLRWQHPTLGLLAPDRFMTLAEESGAIVPIGRWVLRAACEHARRWQERHGITLSVAVNLSPRQIQDPALSTELDEVLRDTGLSPALLELDLTETMAMRNPEQAARQIRKLSARGVRLAMDDFGTGYSSLGYLKRFPLHSVKIDRSFVHDLPHDDDDVAISRAVIAMAHSLRLRVTAEGVERREQIDFLRGEGCEEYQGYYCSPPVPEERLLTLLSANRACAPASAGGAAAGSGRASRPNGPPV